MIFALAKKEIRDMFASPIAYVFICVFLFLSFWFYFNDVFVINEASLTRFFVVVPILFIVFLPAVSMGRWADEKRSGTAEILLTLPVSDWQLVLGKFFGCLFFLFVVLLLTVPLVFVMSRLGSLDAGEIIGNYIGLMLLGACYLAFGLFVSSLTKNQIVAFLVSVFVFFAFFIIADPNTVTYLPKALVPFFHNLSFHYHFLSLMRGVVDIRDVVYYVSMLGLFLFLNVLSLSSRKLTLNISAVVLIVGIVFFSNYLAQFSRFRLDLTRDKQYSLAKATDKVLTHLDDRLTIKLYFSEDLPAAMLPIKQQIMDTIAEFQARAPKPIVVENVNPTLNDDREAETQTMGIAPVKLNVRDKDNIEVKKIYLGIALYYKDKREVISVVKQVSNLEYLLDLSILKLVRDNPAEIGVYIGSTADRYQLLSQLIEPVGHRADINIEDKDWAQKKLNALLVINPAGVDAKFTSDLDALLVAGTNIIVFAGRTEVNDDLTASKRDSGLESWLSDKGVELSDKPLLDVEQNAQAGFQTSYGQVYMPYPFWIKTYAPNMDRNNAITAGLEEALFPWSNVLQVTSDASNSQWSAATLISSSDKSFLQPDETLNLSPQYVRDMTELPVFESLPLAVLLTNKQSVVKPAGQLFVLASPYLLQDNFLQQSAGNVLLASNLIEHAAMGDDLIGVNSRGQTAHPLKALDQSQKNSIKWGVMIGVPLLSVIVGMIVLAIIKNQRKKFVETLVFSQS